MEATLICPRCGQTNPTHRFWCRQCGADLSRVPASAIRKFETELTSSAGLYERVLEDLKNLLRRGESPLPVHESIQRFYSTRLQTVLAQKSCLELVRQLGPLPRAAASRLEETHRELHAAISQWPREDFLQRMASDVDDEITQRRMALLKADRIRELLAVAESCLDLDKAEQYLEQARAMAPDNAKVAARLVELRREAGGPRELAKPQPPRAVVAAAAGSPSEAQPVKDRRSSPVPAAAKAVPARPVATPAVPVRPTEKAAAAPSFAEEEDELPRSVQRLLEAASQWSAILKPFLLDNVGWFVGAFLIVAGFVVLIAAFWHDIGANPVLMRSLVFWLLALTTGVFFALAYYMRRKYPQLETSSNVLLIIVALLIPLVFAAAALTTLAPTATEKGPPSTTAITVSALSPAFPLVERAVA